MMPTANTISGNVVPATSRTRRTDNDGLGTRLPDQPLMASNIGEAPVIRQRFHRFRIAMRNPFQMQFS
jgi:hypothetical protein